MGKTTHYYAKRGEHVVIHRQKNNGCGSILGILFIIWIVCIFGGC